MIKRCALLISITLVSLCGWAQDSRNQRSKEFGVGVGSFYYLGELNQKQFNAITPGPLLSFRANINRRIGFNFSFASGKIEGADSLSSEGFKRNRNLHFQSSIQELSVVFEINYFDYQVGNKKYPFSPYLYFGFSAFRFNPKALDNNNEFQELQPIGTEGQNLDDGTPYNLFNFAVPFGIGIRFNVVGNLGIAIHTGMRRTYTDYLDDVSTTYADPQQFEVEDRQFVDRSIAPARPDGSNTGLQRGQPSNKDWFNHTGITLTFKVQKKRNFCPAWYNN